MTSPSSELVPESDKLSNTDSLGLSLCLALLFLALEFFNLAAFKTLSKLAKAFVFLGPFAKRVKFLAELSYT